MNGSIAFHRRNSPRTGRGLPTLFRIKWPEPRLNVVLQRSTLRTEANLSPRPIYACYTRNGHDGTTT
eukprot:6473694-Pyramimonas_sp.AAC.1